MGNKNSSEVMPYIPLFFPDDIDEEINKKQIFPTSLEYSLVRLLLNLEKVKELLDLKETIQVPLSTVAGKSPRVSFLSDLYKIHQKGKGLSETHDHSMLAEISKSIQSHSSTSQGVPKAYDPLLKILTLLHFSISSLSLSDESQNNTRISSAVREIIDTNYTDLYEFDRDIITDILYRDVQSAKGRSLPSVLEDSGAEQRFNEVKQVLTEEDASFLEDLSKIPNFYSRVVKPFLFSVNSIPNESRFERAVAAYKPLIYKSLANSNMDLQHVSPLILNLNLCVMKYFYFAHNFTFGVLNLSNRVSIGLKNIIVQVYFGNGNNLTTQITYISSVAYRNEQGEIDNTSGMDSLSSNVGDLIDRVSGFDTSNNYKTDYGFAVLTERNGWLYYTTNRDMSLESLAQGNSAQTLRVYFFSVLKSPLFNQSSGDASIFAVLNNKQIGLFAEAKSVKLNKVGSQIASDANVAVNQMPKMVLLNHEQYSGANYRTINDFLGEKWTDISVDSLKSKVADSNKNIEKTSDPKPVDFILNSPSVCSANLNSLWDKSKNSKFHLKIDPGKLFSMIFKYSLNWNDLKKSRTENLLRTLLPNILIFELNILGKYIDGPSKIEFDFLKTQCSRVNVQLPTGYNLQAMLAKAGSGHFHEIYRKSLNNNQVTSFYEEEQAVEPSNPLNTVDVLDYRKIADQNQASNAIQDAEDNKKIIRVSSSLDKIDFSKVKYLVFQQSLASS